MKDPVWTDSPRSRPLGEKGSSRRTPLPRGDKSDYTSKEKRQAKHIEEGYEKRGKPEEDAERIAWATVNKNHPKDKE